MSRRRLVKTRIEQNTTLNPEDYEEFESSSDSSLSSDYSYEDDTGLLCMANLRSLDFNWHVYKESLKIKKIVEMAKK